MRVHKILTIPAFFVVLIFYTAACESPVNNSFEESIAPYLELEAVQGASNTTFTVHRGTAMGMNSFFAFDVSDVSDNTIVKEGLTEGWCLEWNKPITSNGDVHRGIDNYSTYGSETWRPLNYLLSIKNRLIEEDPTITYKEIQVSIWSLIEEPKFDLDRVLASGDMPSSMLTDGQPNFSIEKVNAIVEKVRRENSSYTYSENSPYLIFAHTGDNSQNGGFLTCDNPDTEFCEGFYTISGSVFIDGNEDQVKNALESGAQNVTVSITDSHGNTIRKSTSSTGEYSFNVYTGEAETEYTIEVKDMTENPDDFNEGLFTNYSPTTPVLLNVTINSENISGIDFGFTPEVEKMIQQFEEGTITLNTESSIFWRKQMLLARNSVRTPGRGNTGRDIPAMEISSEELLGYLIEIENLFLPEPFQFGSKKFQAAFDILNLSDKSLSNRLLIELLTAELNVVSGRGSGNPDFDLALLGYGESVAAELFPAASVELFNLNSTIETLPVPTESSLTTTEDTISLLSAFNRSGTGGVGN
ncbi:hypothetical protein [Rhodohalobacter barkolensis]|uniref:SD-repeat containing protein B domain-containing protein n=1 Tax=Rhodohalobacter barkolensis TaxID=2053187 RepID=A0A2N0VGP0_9BACT|nr:hypothetical protein [Rhodohalobacter barkolensis]PKD43334.1 hypothetical protein CWD77_12045 [Rhodohalobacter barkolensis]